MKRLLNTSVFLAMCLISTPVDAITLNGVVANGLGASADGLTLRATQNTQTQFGNSTGTQSSNGGSEFNQLFADIDNTNGILNLGITGNLQSNFNKLWIFFDAVDGGENVLAGNNADGGNGEINSLEGMTFPAGVTMDHGIRLEIGGGFYGVNFFDLITNSGQSIQSGGGAAALPLSDAGGARGITFGWDNSNTAGVMGGTGTGPAVEANAATATTGFEFSIDLSDAFNETQGDIKVLAFITSGDGNFGSNQLLPGIGGGDNLGDLSNYTVTSVVTVPGDPVAGSLFGDVDGDGDVDLFEDSQAGDGVSDFDIIRMNWLETNESFGMALARTDGDLNENGEVSIEDFREWKNAFNGSAASIAAAFASLGTNVVPEPSSVLLAGLLTAGMIAGWRRGKTS